VVKNGREELAQAGDLTADRVMNSEFIYSTIAHGHSECFGADMVPIGVASPPILHCAATLAVESRRYHR
jgi:hypothetical protein